MREDDPDEADGFDSAGLPPLPSDPRRIKLPSLPEPDPVTEVLGPARPVKRQRMKRMRQRRRRTSPEAHVVLSETVRTRVLVILKDTCPACQIAPRMSDVASELGISKAGFWRWLRKDRQTMMEKYLLRLDTWAQRVEMVKRAFARAGVEETRPGRKK